MQRTAVIQLLKCIGSETIDNLPEILEPFLKYGKSVGAFIKAVKGGVCDYNSLNSMKEKAKKELIEAAENELVPKYMDCIIFGCRKGCRLRVVQKESLHRILTRQLADGDMESRKLISAFIDEYMGGEIDMENTDECEIGEDYISFNFCDMAGTKEFPYDEEDAELVMGALNKLLNEKLFDWYLIDGHMESYDS